MKLPVPPPPEAYDGAPGIVIGSIPVDIEYRFHDPIQFQKLDDPSSQTAAAGFGSVTEQTGRGFKMWHR